MMVDNKIYILHEYGDKNHYQALEYLCNHKNLKIEYYEFSITKNIIKSILKKDFNLLKKQFINIKFLINLFFTNDKKVILGIAPYDFRIILLSRILKNHKVYYHTSWIYWDESFYPKKLFVNFYIKRKWKSFLEKEIKSIFSVSKSTKKSLLENYNIQNDKIKVIYHSFNEKIFFYKERNINNKSIFVGRLEKEKGIDELLEFFSKNSQYQLLIAGKGSLLNKVKQYEKQYENIHYLGFLKKEELAMYYNKVTFLLLNSKRQNYWEELFGMVIIEAMSCGVIPITTNHLGPKEILRNNDNGFIFNENNYINELDKILSTNNQELERLRKKAVIKSKDFTTKEIYKRWDKIIR